MIRNLKMAVKLLIILCGCQEANKGKPVAAEANSMVISKIQLRDTNDQPVNWNQFKGKTVFINFWATWCKPCTEEMPSIEKAQSILQNEEVVFLLASGETAVETQDFRANHSYPFNYVRIENLEELNIQALPTTFIFNPKGDLVFSEMGSRNWADSNNINMLLKIAKQND